MQEKYIVGKILAHLRTLPECYCWKEHGGQFGTAGLPDIIVCYKGRFIAFEVKTPSGKLTKLQEITLGKITAAGGTAVKVTSVSDVKSVMEALNNVQ